MAPTWNNYSHVTFALLRKYRLLSPVFFVFHVFNISRNVLVVKIMCAWACQDVECQFWGATSTELNFKLYYEGSSKSFHTFFLYLIELRRSVETFWRTLVDNYFFLRRTFPWHSGDFNPIVAWHQCWFWSRAGQWLPYFRPCNWYNLQKLGSASLQVHLQVDQQVLQVSGPQPPRHQGPVLRNYPCIGAQPSCYLLTHMASIAPKKCLCNLTPSSTSLT